MQKKGYTYSIFSIFISLLVWEVIFFAVFFSVYFYFSEKVESFRIENKEWMLLFFLIPVWGFFFIHSLYWKNKKLNQLVELRLRPYLFKPFSSAKVFLKYFFLRNTIAFFIVALLNPQFGKGKQKAISEGIEIMIALDISNSMRAMDLDENRNRLKVAKMSIERLMNDLHGDKLGIIIFAGDAFVQVPLTSDYRAAKLFLNSIEPDMISNQGTSIGLAINKAMESFDLENGVNKAIIVISDGEDHEQEAIIAAQYAKENNVVVNTVGMGTTKGAVIPDFKNGKQIGLKKDSNGNTVVSKLNPEMLMEIAQVGGGSYTQAQGTYVNLTGLIESIKQIDKKELDSNLYTDYVDQFQWFIGLGIICFIIYFFISTKRSGIIHKIQDYEI